MAIFLFRAFRFLSATTIGDCSCLDMDMVMPNYWRPNPFPKYISRAPMATDLKSSYMLLFL